MEIDDGRFQQGNSRFADGDRLVHELDPAHTSGAQSLVHVEVKEPNNAVGHSFGAIGEHAEDLGEDFDSNASVQRCFHKAEGFNVLLVSLGLVSEARGAAKRLEGDWLDADGGGGFLQSAHGWASGGRYSLSEAADKVSVRTHDGCEPFGCVAAVEGKTNKTNPLKLSSY
jgi:hypothetical protein